MHPFIRNLFAFFLFLLLSRSPVYGAEDFLVKDIRVEGLQRIAAGTVFNYLPVSVGERMDPGKTAEIIKALYKTGFFKDVRLERDGDVLVVVVTERPSIAKIDISGNKEIETDKLTQALKDIGLAEGRVFNRSVLDQIEQELRRQYFSKGKYGVQLTTTVTPLERNRVAVAIDIKEGKAAKIKQIKLIGNKTYSDKVLLKEFQLSTTGWFSFWTGDDQYSKQKLSGDLEKLRSYYLDRGYLKFRIESTQVSISPDKKDIYITIVFDEGQIYKVSDLKLAGNLVVEPEQIYPLIDVRRNEPFSRKRVTNTTEQISKLLSNYGYAFANVNSIPEIDDTKREVALTFFVDPGKRVYVHRINMAGNARTRDEVLRREMRQMEASWFSTERINKSRDRLKRLGFFEDVTIETPAVAGSTDEVNINVNVKERPSGNFLAGVGFSRSDGIILNASITENNFLGTGKKMTLAFNNSTATTIYQVAYTNPYYTIDGISRGFNLSYRATDFSKLNVSNYTTDIGRAGMNFGFPISEFQRAGFSADIDDITLKTGSAPSDEVQNFIDAYGDKFNDLRLLANWSYDSRDNFLFATKGMLHTFAVEAALPGSDLEYYKADFIGQGFIPLTRNLTLMLKGQIGYGDGYGKLDTLPFFYNFFAGGPRSVRGYEQWTLGPRDSNDDPFGGNLLTVANIELQFPPPGDAFKDTLRLSAFFDLGNVFDTHGLESGSGTGFAVDKIRYSTGLAGSWLSPIGALTVSLGFPLNASSEDKREVFQFNFGVGL